MKKNRKNLHAATQKGNPGFLFTRIIIGIVTASSTVCQNSFIVNLCKSPVTYDSLASSIKQK